MVVRVLGVQMQERAWMQRNNEGRIAPMKNALSSLIRGAALVVISRLTLLPKI
jgi:hypothetical protein